MSVVIKNNSINVGTITQQWLSMAIGEPFPVFLFDGTVTEPTSLPNGLGAFFCACDGGLISDAESVLNNHKRPNINGGYALLGALGNITGSESEGNVKSHNHNWNGSTANSTSHNHLIQWSGSGPANGGGGYAVWSPESLTGFWSGNTVPDGGTMTDNGAWRHYHVHNGQTSQAFGSGSGVIPKHIKAKYYIRIK